MGALTTIALLAASAAKTGNDYRNQRRAATAAERESNYSAGILEQNAATAREQADDTIARGHESELDVVRGQRGLHGSQRAALAAQGINIDSGSALDVQQSDENLAHIHELRIRNNAEREAWGFRTQADDYLAQAQLTRSAGHNQAQSIRSQSVSTLLGGAAQLADVWRTSPKGVGSSIAKTAPLPKGVKKIGETYGWGNV